MASGNGSRTSRQARVAEAAPLADGELDALFTGLADASRIALAVSGGGDSLALLDAVDRWRRLAPGRPEVVVLVVDHRLRKGSGAEASAVAAVARARGMEARVLVRKGPRPTADVERQVRIARYRLLVGACREIGASHLVVAHHQDDVAETFLMRLRRGAGVFGLAAMRPLLSVGGMAIVRPFLGVPRARLAATAAAAGLTPAVDPMNADPRFERVRMRRMLPVLAGAGIAADHLAALAHRFADFADAIDRAADVVIGEAVKTDALAVAWLDAARFAAAGPDVRVRVLTRLLIAVGGDEYPPRFDRLAALLDAVVRHDGSVRFKRTLAGCVIEWRNRRFAIYRELGRDGIAPVKVRVGFSGIFDHRFAVTVGAGAPSGLLLQALGEAGRRLAAGRAGTGGHPPGAVAALPALWRRGKVVAVPSLLPGAAGFPVTVEPVLAERLSHAPLFPDVGPDNGRGG